MSRYHSFDRYNKSFYSIGGNRIDLRSEFKQLLEKYGQWVIVRHSLGIPSDTYDEYYNESAVGAEYKYVDILTLARFTYYGMHSGRGDLEEEIPANLLTPQPIFYIPNDVHITEKDIIFTLVEEKSYGDKPEKIDPVRDYKERYDVTLVVPMRADLGRIEYYAVYVKGKK